MQCVVVRLSMRVVRTHQWLSTPRHQAPTCSGNVPCTITPMLLPHMAHIHYTSPWQQVGATLRVLNLSQQSDSSDLMGGFRPIDPATTVLPLLDPLPGLLQATWPKGDHGPFLQRLQQYAARGKWAALLTALAAAGDKALKRLQAEGGGRKRKRDTPRRDALWCVGVLGRVDNVWVHDWVSGVGWLCRCSSTCIAAGARTHMQVDTPTANSQRPMARSPGSCSSRPADRHCRVRWRCLCVCRGTAVPSGAAGALAAAG